MVEGGLMYKDHLEANLLGAIIRDDLLKREELMVNAQKLWKKPSVSVEQLLLLDLK
jgi:hypothetical protein